MMLIVCERKLSIPFVTYIPFLSPEWLAYSSPFSATSTSASNRDGSLFPLRRFGESFRDVTHPRSSPTKMIGCFGLNAIFVSFALRTIFCDGERKVSVLYVQTVSGFGKGPIRTCSHIGSCLFSCKSYTNTLPSLVTAANVVLLVGDHATSPTAAFKSNDIAGFEKRWSQSFTVQSALALMNTAFWEEKGKKRVSRRVSSMGS